MIGKWGTRGEIWEGSPKGERERVDHPQTDRRGIGAVEEDGTVVGEGI